MVSPDKNYSTKDYREREFDPSKSFVKNTSFFFLDGVLHKKLRANRSLNIMYCMKYPERKEIAYPLDLIKKNQKRAYRISEVGKMVNRNPRTIWNAFMDDKIPKPQKANGKSGKVYWMFFTEEQVWQIRDYYASVHQGRPRKDKQVTTWNVPTREQLREDMGHARMLYVKNEDGEMVPVWIAEEY